jgi:serine/threonine protein kinase
MGEVYRATDTNLKRQGAIKVLPDDHGLERSDGVTGLVMELVEGPTLAERIDKEPISVDEAVPLTKQIAEALGAAHEQGIRPAPYRSDIDVVSGRPGAHRPTPAWTCQD